jgi:thioredoxin-like negative regulator of GroEL
LLAFLLLGNRGAVALERIAPGAVLRDFTLPLLEGQPFTLRSSLGPKGTVITFWATWSPRSAEVLSDLQIFYKKHGKGDLQVVAVNVEHETWDPGDAERIRAYLAGEGVTFPVVVDKGLSVYESYGFTSVPSTVLADPSGTVIDVLPGYPELQRVEFLEHTLEVLGLARPPAPVPQTAAPAPAGHTPNGKAAAALGTGKALLKKGRRVDAVATLRNAVREDPEYLEAYQALAEALDGSGQPEEAEQVRRAAAAITSGRPAAAAP